MASDPFGRAVRDHHRNVREEPLIQRDGDAELEHPIEQFYFGGLNAADADWFDSWLDGPLLDLGAGAGRHTLYFQERFEVVAIEISDHLVETMVDRGVEDARTGDMFALREQFDRDRFQSVLACGTQLGLAGSMQGLREFLGDLAAVTKPAGTAVLDCFDPNHDTVDELLGYRSDPMPGLAHRVMWFEYEGEAGSVLQFRLFSPDRIRAATAGTGWEVGEVTRPGGDESAHYRIALEKR